MSTDLVFPAHLPAPLLQNHEIDMLDLALRTPFESGEQRVRRLYRRAPKTAQLSYWFTQAQFDSFAIWFESTLKAGAFPFDTQAQAQGQRFLSWWTANFIEPYTYEAVATRGTFCYRVRAQVLLLDGPVDVRTPPSLSSSIVISLDLAPKISVGSISLATRISIDFAMLAYPSFFVSRSLMSKIAAVDISIAGATRLPTLAARINALDIDLKPQLADMVNDIYFEFCVLALAFEGSTIVDTSPLARPVTAHNGAVLSSVSPKYGSGCLLTTDNGMNLTVPRSTDWDFGDAPFTVQGWAQGGSVGSLRFLISDRSSGTGDVGWYVATLNGALVMSINPGGGLSARITGGTIPSTGYFHWALTGNGTSVSLYLNGSYVGGTGQGSIPASNGPLYIGSSSDEDGTRDWVGRQDCIYIHKGVALWSGTSPFTPPTGAYSPRPYGAVMDSRASSLWSYVGIRKGLTTYAGPAMRVRRSTDNAETDIGFRANNRLNADAMLTWAAGASVYVKRLYDNTPAANDWVAPSNAAQPKIVDAGVFLQKLIFDGVDDCMSSVNQTPAVSAFSIFSVCDLRSPSALQVILEQSSDENSHNAFLIYWDTTSSGGAFSGTHQVSPSGYANVETNQPSTIGASIGWRFDRTKSLVADQVKQWVNGSANVGSGAASTGAVPSGNFAADYVYLGARNNASLFSPLELKTLAIYSIALSDAAMVSASQAIGDQLHD